MTKLLTISDVKKMLQEENMDYKVDSYEYGFVSIPRIRKISR
jgi:hypothetical protein